MLGRFGVEAETDTEEAPVERQDRSGREPKKHGNK